MWAGWWSATALQCRHVSGAVPLCPDRDQVPAQGTFGVTIGDPTANGTTYVRDPPAAGAGSVRVVVLEVVTCRVSGPDAGKHDLDDAPALGLVECPHHRAAADEA